MLMIMDNKTLAAQLYGGFREFATGMQWGML